MTDIEIQIAVAERCGIFLSQSDSGKWTVCTETTQSQAHATKEEAIEEEISDYLNSIDAIRSAVMEQGEEFKQQFVIEVNDLKIQRFNDNLPFRFIDITALDWSTCFLAAWEALEKKEKV